MSRRTLPPAKLAELESKIEAMRPAVEKARQHADDNRHHWPRQARGFALKATTTKPAAAIQATHAALHQTAVDLAARNAAAQADADRTQAVADLLHRYQLVHTMAGARVAASKHDVATLRTLVQNRADAFGRISPCSQLALMRDLQFTPLKDTTP